MEKFKIALILVAGIIIGSSLGSFNFGNSAKIFQSSVRETFVGGEKMILDSEVDLNSEKDSIVAPKTEPEKIVKAKTVPQQKPAPKNSEIKIPEVNSGEIKASTSVTRIIKEDALDHPIIYAVQISGETSSNDFVVIINPLAEDLDVSGWQLKKRTSGTSESSLRKFPADSIIPSGKYFIWANSKDDFHLKMKAQIWSTQTLAANNSVALINKEGEIVDAVGWGNKNANPFLEGRIFPENPENGMALVRKVVEGVPVDTNDNMSDFEIK